MSAHPITERRSRRTGTVVTVGHGTDLGLDTSVEGGGPWYTICEHGNLVSHLTLDLARWHAPAPDSWCDECQATARQDDKP